MRQIALQKLLDWHKMLKGFYKWDTTQHSETLWRLTGSTSVNVITETSWRCKVFHSKFSLQNFNVHNSFQLNNHGRKSCGINKLFSEVALVHFCFLLEYARNSFLGWRRLGEERLKKRRKRFIKTSIQFKTYKDRLNLWWVETEFTKGPIKVD